MKNRPPKEKKKQKTPNINGGDAQHSTGKEENGALKREGGNHAMIQTQKPLAPPLSTLVSRFLFGLDNRELWQISEGGCEVSSGY